MDFDSLGEWCKWLEKNFSPDVMIPTLPVIIRLDGNNFSKWTESLVKPFDSRLTTLMIETTKYLVSETNAVVGYTQSDEITLILYSKDRKSAIYNDGKKQKILSKLSAKCTAFFNENLPFYIDEHKTPAIFDCRIYQTPTLNDACSQLLWRENDATRNSISMLAQSLFSHNTLQNLNTDKMQDLMMLEKGVNWNDLGDVYKRGSYIKRSRITTKFSESEMENLPPKHYARTHPDLEIERNVIGVMLYPILNKIKNREGVIFNDEIPIII
jgi:tRNA(His) 5'-end guanylyltransferase